MNADLFLMPALGTIATLVGSVSLALGPLTPAQDPSLAARAALASFEDLRGDDHETVIERARDGMFYVDARVNDRMVRFLIDTGATHIVLSPGDAARVAAEPDAARPRAALRTAGGRTRMDWVRLGQVGVGGRTEHDVRAVVASDQSAVPVSLMGQNMLSRLSSLTISGDRLILR